MCVCVVFERCICGSMTVNDNTMIRDVSLSLAIQYAGLTTKYLAACCYLTLLEAVCTLETLYNFTRPQTQETCNQ